MKKIKTSWLLRITGVVFVLIGLYCFINPMHAYVELVRLSGLALIIKGIVLQISSSSTQVSFIKEKRSMRAESIADFIFGILLIFNPFFSFIMYPLLMGSWILASGLIKIITSLSIRKQIRSWVFILLIGILFCISAFVIFYSPLNRASDITRIIGVFFISLGFVLIYDSGQLKRKHHTINLLY